jgi:ketosteroid isomerase-like protein
MSNLSPEAMEVALVAFEAFSQGLASGQWQPFLDLLTEDVAFWFPQEPFQGLHQGKDQAIAFLHWVSQAIPWHSSLTLERLTGNPTTAIFEVQLAGPTIQPGCDRAMIAFEIRDNKISAFRQYLLLFHPAHPPPNPPNTVP